MPTFTTPGPISATVEVAGAHVRVTASDRTDTVVTVAPINAASRKDVKVAEKTKVGFGDAQLSVKTTTSGDKDGSVAITIDLPTGSELAAYLAHSTVQTDGFLGESKLHMASGTVQLDRIEALQANISSGDVAINRIAGSATVDGGAFDMRIGEVDGAVGFQNSGGQAWVGHAAADVEFTSGSSDLTIDRADGNVNATTGNGAIRIGQMAHGQAKLMNGSGNIEVGISNDVAASIDANSERGAVHNFITAGQEPGAADSKVSVFARTRHGDITIQRAAR
jgi:hypothetical protein